MLAICTSSFRCIGNERKFVLNSIESAHEPYKFSKPYKSRSRSNKRKYANVIARKEYEFNYDNVRALPNAKNPIGLYMLSNLDQTVPFPVELLFAFPTNKSLVNIDVGQIMKQSLSKVLEVYYPLAGRVKVGLDRKVVVDCDVEGGVPFAETFTDEDMVTAVGDIAMIDMQLANKLVYHGLDVPLLEIQVNRFRCGGLILGFRFNHMMFDGIGFMDFMKSWTEIARGLPLSIKPHLDRSILSPRKPPKIHFPHPEFSNLESSRTSPIPHNKEKIIVKKSFIFTPKMVSRLKELAMQKNNKNEPVSLEPTTFEMIFAFTWICWTKANKFGPDETSRIGTAVDGRYKLKPRIPRRYFGNCIGLPCAQSRVEDLTSQPFSYAIGIMHDAVKAVTGDYIRSMIDFVEITRKPLGQENKIFTSTWTRLPYYELDFGWGVASQFAPGAFSENIGILFFHGKDNKTLVLSMTLPVDAMELFQELISPLND